MLNVCVVDFLQFNRASSLINFSFNVLYNLVHVAVDTFYVIGEALKYIFSKYLSRSNRI